MQSYFDYITEKINLCAKPEKAAWLINYVKHDIKSLGVGIPELREIIRNFNTQFRFSQKSMAEQKDILNALMSGEFTEYKLSAILYIQLFWNDKNPAEILGIVSGWFDNHWIYDWNVCDWLCVRILTPIVDKHPAVAVKEFLIWNNDAYLWKARASLVPFAECKTINEHKEIIYKFSEILIKSEHRFCKTSVGWVLRQISKNDKKYVTDFLEMFKEYTIPEVIKNATKYL